MFTFNKIAGIFLLPMSLMSFRCFYFPSAFWESRTKLLLLLLCCFSPMWPFHIPQAEKRILWPKILYLI